MANFLEVFRLKLSVTGPLFIGSGNEISKKEYVILGGGRSIGILDVNCFFQNVVRKKGLQREFENFFINDRWADLKGWIGKNRINIKEVQGCFKYTIPIGDREMGIERGRSKLNIKEFMKDPYGLPYIPGSSLKGMLRTALLYSRVLKSKGKYIGTKNQILENTGKKEGRTRYLASDAKNLQVKTFHLPPYRDEKRLESAVNDELSGLIVGDSEPISIKSLILCQKIDIRCDGIERKLNVMRECLKPGTEVEIPVTIDGNICSVSREELRSSIKTFSDFYEEAFSSKFQGIVDSADAYGGGFLYLGGGSGFVSKTLVYPLFGKNEGVRVTQKIFENTMNRGIYNKHGHGKDSRVYRISPHMIKCTRYEGKLFQMGQCRLEIP